MLGFLRFILVAFLIFTVVGYIFRFLLKIYISRLAQRMNSNNQNKGEKVGDTFIKKTNTKEKVLNKDIGDYVDYEEVDPKN